MLVPAAGNTEPAHTKACHPPRVTIAAAHGATLYSGQSKRRSDMADETTMGPVGYLVVEFPPDTVTGEGLLALVDLVDKGVVRVLDLVFAQKAEDGTVTVIDVTDLDGDGELDLTIFEGASSNLLDDDDISKAGGVLAPGASAAILLFENLWAIPFVQALRTGGAQLVAAGFVPQDDLAASLDLAESVA